ncbi:glycerol dehydrogenase [Xanthobacter sp. KR7-225]|uniref:glycerol dehydrogenase n=1 Tax=Xanthobacter sp. KR7-225 TaxID=3156613 RepID=UPI0032B334F5
MRHLKVFGAPSLYVQGPGALATLSDLLATHLSPPPRRVLLVSDALMAGPLQQRIAPLLEPKGLAFSVLGFQGAVTQATARRLAGEARGFAPDLVLAAGGGKGVDMGKAVAHALGVRLATLPTAASQDGATSRVFVLYGDDHRLLRAERLARNPEIVLVDTQILAEAPAELLVSGIGDALVKRFEAAQCVGADGPNMFGARATLAAPALAELCDRVLRAHAVDALAAARAKAPDEAFEKVVEACFLLAGLGFEGAGLSIAHAMTRGLTAVPETASALHGCQVAYALLVQFLLERRSKDFMREQFAFYRKVGLPICLKDFGIAPPRAETLAAIASLTLAAPHARNFERALESDDIVDAMERLEGLSALAPARAA